MRDPKRIKQVLTYIELIWERYPDLRFNQLIDNLQHEYSYSKGGKYNGKYHQNFGTVEHPSYVALTKPDLFHLEDDEFLEFLKTFHVGGFKKQ